MMSHFLGVFSPYRTSAILIRGLYTFPPFLKDKNIFKELFFRKFLSLCSIQERVIVARVRYTVLCLIVLIDFWCHLSTVTIKRSSQEVFDAIIIPNLKSSHFLQKVSFTQI